MRPFFVLAVAALHSLVFSATPPAVRAQYMYLDVNGDGLNTTTDVLTSGTTSVDVWLDTDSNGDGSPAACNTGPEALTMNSYEVFLQASGALTYGSWTDNMGFATSFGEFVSGADAYVGRGSGTILGAGLYKLGTMSISGVGLATLSIIPTSSVNPSATTSFGTECFGNDFDNTYKLGSDWFDVAGTVSSAYEVLAPNGGEQWVAGTPVTVRWLGSALADLAVSYDGGSSWSVLSSNIGGLALNEHVLLAPSIETDFALVRLSFTGQAVTASSSDRSDGVFAIALPKVPPAVAHRLRIAPEGVQASDDFGYSVAGADVNGDGYSDVIVGATDNNGGAEPGYAHVYFGGPSADDTPDLVLMEDCCQGQFGKSVSSAGDMNGDGYEDVIVGMPDHVTCSDKDGAAYLYFGGPSVDDVFDLAIFNCDTDGLSFEKFGWSVSTAGDMNGDGYDDVIVGSLANVARVFYGGPNPDATPDLELFGNAESVSGGGDINGDGYSDVVVGNPSVSGSVCIYYGGPNADNICDVTLSGGEEFGSSVHAGTDVNGDGREDIIVGDGSLPGPPGLSRVYVFFGGSGLVSKDAGAADLILTGEELNDRFGHSVSAGDINGDGCGDVVVGAYGRDAGASNVGRVHVYYGGPGADALADIVLDGEDVSDGFGFSAAVVGDISGDGIPDVAVGALGGAPGGKAYVYDMNRYFVTAPVAGQSWNVGATEAVSWCGAEPADIWLSVDGGQTYDLLESGKGGGPENTASIRVPHAPTKFARVRLTPSNTEYGGDGKSDSLFTIQTSVELLALLAARLPEGGVSITWETDPGPDKLLGYRLEKSASDAGVWQTLVPLTREKAAMDPEGGPGARYRLFAVNGFGEEFLLGESSIRPLTPVAAWPLPYRGGELNVSFATFGGLGGGRSPAQVAIYDVQGRLVRRIAQGSYLAGYQSAVWDGRDDRGRNVAAGVYLLRAESLGQSKTLKLAVLR